MVNLDKCFSKNVREEKKVEISLLLGQRQRNDMGMYLGLPVVVGRSKEKDARVYNRNIQDEIKRMEGQIFKFWGERNYA